MRSVDECGGCFVSHCLLSIREKNPFQFFFGFFINLQLNYNCPIGCELNSIRPFLIKKFNFIRVVGLRAGALINLQLIYNCPIG